VVRRIAASGNQEAMNAFVSVIAGTLSPDEYFAPAAIASFFPSVQVS
jgi:hypothetical protein